MITLGLKESFGMVLGPPGTKQLRTIEVWAAGTNITPHDSSAYVPGFSAAVASSSRRLKQELNLLKHEALFAELSVEDAVSKLVDQGSAAVEAAWFDLRFADWGPTTDDFSCFLVPLRGKLYLACRSIESESVHATEVVLYDLIQVLESACVEMRTSTNDA